MTVGGKNGTCLYFHSCAGDDGGADLTRKGLVHFDSLRRAPGVRWGDAKCKYEMRYVNDCSDALNLK